MCYQNYFIAYLFSMTLLRVRLIVFETKLNIDEETETSLLMVIYFYFDKPCLWLYILHYIHSFTLTLNFPCSFSFIFPFSFFLIVVWVKSTSSPLYEALGQTGRLILLISLFDCGRALALVWDKGLGLCWFSFSYWILQFVPFSLTCDLLEIG